jgi:ATP-dependent Clp protease adaptor protein ClpS
MTATDKPKTKDPQQKKKLIPLYKVLLHNDDVNDMLHVAKSLMQIFNLEAERAAEIMMEAHKTGVALVVIEPFERAEFHHDKLQSAFLTATIEPA